MTRFRYPNILIIPAVLALFVAIFAFAFEGGLMLLVPVIPLIVVLVLLRVGTDVNANGIRVRNPLTSAIYLWPVITELKPDRKGRAVAVLTSGDTVVLPAVRATDLPRVIAASGKVEATLDTAADTASAEQ